MKKYLALLILSLVLLAMLFIYQSSRFFDGSLKMTVCDVGQGDAIHIRSDNGADLLIDGGPNDKVLDCLQNNMPFWDRTIEVIILTHPDADHFRGLVPVLERYSVSHYVTVNVDKNTSAFRLLQNTLEDRNIQTRNVISGDILKIGQTSFEILWPGKDLESKSSNDHAIVGILSFGKFKALLTGDAGVNILSGLNLEKVDILKVPHHGSKTGMNDLILSQIEPSLAIISVGKNSYGHPAPFSLGLLSKYKIETLRTDKDGEVRIKSDGETGQGI
jgi:competence protein ComEC